MVQSRAAARRWRIFRTPGSSPNLNRHFLETAKLLAWCLVKKKGVEGTVKGKPVLSENGRVRDVFIKQDLPFGVGEAVSRGVRYLFCPGKAGKQSSSGQNVF